MANPTETAFDHWMGDVDRLVCADLGVSVFDLPDMSYRDWFDAGLEPHEAARLVTDDSSNYL